MPGQTDNADRPSTLPLPELNPLQNPILGQHMGRWAEVYFTSPPEKREQAVLELLRELEVAGESSEPSVASPISVSEQDSLPVSFPSFRTAETHLMTAFCPSCGHRNRTEQKFCGMCGIHLQSGSIESALETEGPEQVASADADPDLTVEHRESLFSAAENAAGEPIVPGHEFEQVRPDREVRWSNDTLGGIPDSSLPKSLYRVYAGMSVAILLVVLSFVGWRATRAKGSADLSVQSPPTIASKPTAPASIPKAKDESQPSVVPHNSTGEASNTRQDQDQTVTQASIPAAQKQQDKMPVNGAEELAIAQTYLNGTEGKERNAEEAVKWLWKAVAKRNTDATLELSDLYLRGEGITKNCDQARVLLDAAALKGIKTAGERLRNLQSFGCE